MNAAERQAQAQQDVERIGKELIDTLGCYGIAPPLPEVKCAVRELLIRDVIRVGARPHVEKPMRGQRTIDDEACGSFRSDLVQAREMSERQAALT